MKDDDNKPGGLPPVPVSTHRSTLDRSRICPKCDREGRVISNHTGVSVLCNPCKYQWPISSAARAPVLPMAPPRGLGKKTIVEPNWDLAYDNDD